MTMSNDCDFNPLIQYAINILVERGSAIIEEEYKTEISESRITACFKYLNDLGEDDNEQ
jgi:hypothetical protein